MSADAPEAGLYPIRVVAELTGINPVTIRAWERRYGLVQPARTPGSHRLYSRRDLERLRAAASLVAAGVSISQAVRQLNSAANDESADLPAERAGHWRDLVLQRLETLDYAGMHAALDGAEVERPGLSQAVLDLLGEQAADLPPLLARCLQSLLESRLALHGSRHGAPAAQLLVLLPPQPEAAAWLLALAATVAPRGLCATVAQVDGAADGRDALARAGSVAALTHAAELAEALAETTAAPLFSRAGSRRSVALGDQLAAARDTLVTTLERGVAA
jgi:DNA-binding transcriptional MerR regulator